MLKRKCQVIHIGKMRDDHLIMVFVKFSLKKNIDQELSHLAHKILTIHLKQ